MNADNLFVLQAIDILFVLTECVFGYFFHRLLSRPENWLTEEHARVQIWENVLSKCETANASFVVVAKVRLYLSTPMDLIAQCFSIV